tara:strand:+ start:758 stop:2071 length:1314 start_codon:yes stop_codon:yes gene_type:complete
MNSIDAPKAPNSLAKTNLWGAIVIIFGFFGFMLWSVFTPLDSAVVAQGVIKVSSEKKKVQHFEGGIVKNILVKDGDYVNADQVLLILDETFAGADHQILYTQYQELQVRESLLLAQRDLVEELVFPPYILANIENNTWLANQVVSAKTLFQISRNSLLNRQQIIDSQIKQINEQKTGLGLELKSKNEQLSFMADEIASWGKLLEQKYVNKLRYLEVKGDYAELQGEVIKIESEVNGSVTRVEELELEKNRLAHVFRETAANELVDIQYQLKDLTKRIESASNVLGRIDIKAPVSGKVVGLNVYTLGAVIKSGDTILEIVPQEDELIVGVKISPIDIDKVVVNLPARIRMSSYKQHEFPEFSGIVESVSADVFQDDQTLESFYTARIKIPVSVMQSLPQDQIHPGMPADVMIVTGKSSPAQYLLEPLLNAFRTAWRDS